MIYIEFLQLQDVSGDPKDTQAQDPKVEDDQDGLVLPRQMDYDVSGIMNSTRAHQARVLNGQFFYFLIFLIKLSMSSGHIGLKNMVLELTKLEYHKKW